MTVLATESSSPHRSLLAALYAVALALALPSTIEFVLVSLPLQLGDTRWRFGAMGLLFNSASLLPLLGLSLAAYLSVRLDHRLAARLFAVLLVLFGLGLLVALPLFTLDFLQLRPDVNPNMARTVDLTSVKAIISGIILCIAAFAVGLATWRAAQSMAMRARDVARRGTLVVGPAPTP